MDRELRCTECDRFLGMAHGTVVATIKCSNSKCKLDNQVKVVTGDRSADLRYKFAKAEPKPKKEPSDG